MTRLPMLFVLAFVSILGSGCSAPVLKQVIPVSTDPIGAKIYADGQYVGETPTSISLERNRDHILTLIKDNYRQQDVAISRIYQQERTLLKAVSAGIDAGRFFKNPAMGLNTGLSSMSEQERTGEAYILYPPSVMAPLTPVGVSRLPHEPQTPAGPGSSPSAYGQPPLPTDQRAMAADLAKAGLAVAATQAKPIEKKWTTSSSSSSSTYRSPDGTSQTTRTSKSSTSVGVSVNPVGLINLIDALFK